MSETEQNHHVDTACDSDTSEWSAPAVDTSALDPSSYMPSMGSLLCSFFCSAKKIIGAVVLILVVITVGVVFFVSYNSENYVPGFLRGTAAGEMFAATGGETNVGKDAHAAAQALKSGDVSGAGKLLLAPQAVRVDIRCILETVVQAVSFGVFFYGSTNLSEGGDHHGHGHWYASHALVRFAWEQLTTVLITALVLHCMCTLYLWLSSTKSDSNGTVKSWRKNGVLGYIQWALLIQCFFSIVSYVFLNYHAIRWFKWYFYEMKRREYHSYRRGNFILGHPPAVLWTLFVILIVFKSVAMLMFIKLFRKMWEERPKKIKGAEFLP